MNNIWTKGEVIGWWRKLGNEELNIINSSSSIIRMLRSRRVKWAGHVACSIIMRNAY
jgi:hypothetical protein